MDVRLRAVTSRSNKEGDEELRQIRGLSLAVLLAHANSTEMQHPEDCKRPCTHTAGAERSATKLKNPKGHLLFWQSHVSECTSTLLLPQTNKSPRDWGLRFLIQLSPQCSWPGSYPSTWSRAPWVHSWVCLITITVRSLLWQIKTIMML